MDRADGRGGGEAAAAATAAARRSGVTETGMKSRTAMGVPYERGLEFRSDDDDVRSLDFEEDRRVMGDLGVWGWW